MTSQALTQLRLQEVLDYEPETGVFRWKTQQGKRTDLVGRVAGFSDKLGYVTIRIDYRLHLAHRLAWLYVFGEFPALHLDHQDGNPANNSIENLRPCSQRENLGNSKLCNRNTSGLKGVSRKRGHWGAWIGDHGKSRFLGSFDTPELAHAAYLREAEKVFGEFARAA